jgi:hypothetical protein
MDWLLDKSDPGPRYLTMRDLLGTKPDDPEMQVARRIAHTQGPIADILNAMHPDGYWEKSGPGYNPKYRSIVWAIQSLAQLGADVNEDPRVAQACNYLIGHSLTREGQFTYNGAASGVIDCLQGNLCWATRALGYDHPNLPAAFEWMARMETGEGIAPSTDRQAPVRYYSVKSGPGFQCGANSNLPCAWGAAKVMLAFSSLSRDQRTPLIDRAIQLGIDFLFEVDLLKAEWPSGDNAKPSRNWWKFGFPVFYITDLLQIAEALVGLGYGSDPRMAGLLSYIESKQDQDGRWLLEYDYTGKTWVDLGVKGQPSKWVTIRALRVLKTAYTSNERKPLN